MGLLRLVFPTAQSKQLQAEWTAGVLSCCWLF